MYRLPRLLSWFAPLGLAASLVATGCSQIKPSGSDNDAGAVADASTYVEPDLVVNPNSKMTTTVVAPGTPADAPQQFGGADTAALAPKIEYPPAGALIPPNLNELEVQWTPAAGTNLYEVAFTGGLIDLRIYTVCNANNGGCSLVPDEGTWMAISNAGRGRTLSLTVRAASASGGPVGTSVSQDLSFSNDDMLGGLYYWAAGAGAVNRYDFGRRGQKAEPFYTTAQASGAICVGCHAMSRGGGRIAVGLNAPTPAPGLRVVDVATRNTLFDVVGGAPILSNFEALTPDGTKLVTTEAGGLTVRDAATGALIGANPQVPSANMPDFSPDGKNIVFAREKSFLTLSTRNATLWTATFDGTSFGPTKQIVAEATNNFYPSFSPDGSWIVFNQAGGDSYDNKAAQVKLVSANGGGVVDLSAVNAIVGNSWPKWAPFIHHFQGSTIFWITYSSRRPIGLKGGVNAQLWMVPIDVQKLVAGQDPGYPPIWLPFQDDATGNHIAQWVEKVARQPCEMGVENGGCPVNETCENGECVPKIQ